MSAAQAARSTSTKSKRTVAPRLEAEDTGRSHGKAVREAADDVVCAVVGTVESGIAYVEGFFKALVK